MQRCILLRSRPISPPAHVFPRGPNRGELICFATNNASTFQVAWNELTGTGTYLDLANTATGVVQPRQGFKYNAWAFAARNATGLAPDNRSVEQGTPGDLVLSGANASGAYDACPAYNIVNFMPYGATLGNISASSQWLSVSSCNQDLRENYTLYLTKLDFTVWNSAENSFTGSYACVDSVNTIPLDGPNQPTPPIVVQAQNFDSDTVGTPNARFQVDGISATPPCPNPTVASGLVAVYNTWVGIDGDIPGSR